MANSTNPARITYYTRGDLELELAQLALALMRAAPEAFAPLGMCGIASPASPPSVAAFQKAAARLLERTRAHHRTFVSARLRELARSCAGLNFDGFSEWLSNPSAIDGTERRRFPRTESIATATPH